MNKYSVSLKWKNNSEAAFTYDSYNRDHDVAFSGNQHLLNSASPEYKGSNNAANPEELLASALASCHMLTFLAIASKSGYHVLSYDCRAEAMLEKNENGKMAVTEINLYPTIEFTKNKIPDSAQLEKLHHQSHANCFIAQSIKSKVNVY